MAELARSVAEPPTMTETKKSAKASISVNTYKAQTNVPVTLTAVVEVTRVSRRSNAFRRLHSNSLLSILPPSGRPPACLFGSEALADHQPSDKTIRT